MIVNDRYVGKISILYPDSDEPEMMDLTAYKGANDTIWGIRLGAY